MGSFLPPRMPRGGTEIIGVKYPAYSSSLIFTMTFILFLFFLQPRLSFSEASEIPTWWIIVQFRAAGVVLFTLRIVMGES